MPVGGAISFQMEMNPLVVMFKLLQFPPAQCFIMNESQCSPFVPLDNGFI